MSLRYWIPLLRKAKKILNMCCKLVLKNITAASVDHQEQIAKAKSQHEISLVSGASL